MYVTQEMYIDEAIFGTWWHETLLLQETGMMTYILQCHLLALYLIVTSSQMSRYNILIKPGNWRSVLFSFLWLDIENRETYQVCLWPLFHCYLINYLRDAADIFHWQRWLSYLEVLFHARKPNFFHFIHKTFMLASISYTNCTERIFFNWQARCLSKSNLWRIFLIYI